MPSHLASGEGRQGQEGQGQKGKEEEILSLLSPRIVEEKGMKQGKDLVATSDPGLASSGRSPGNIGI